MRTGVVNRSIDQHVNAVIKLFKSYFYMSLSEIFANVPGAQAYQGFWTYQSSSAAFSVSEVIDKKQPTQKVCYITPGVATQTNPCLSHMTFFCI